MAGFSQIYCVGDEGGFLRSDGINPIYLQIWVGNGERHWLEVHYFVDNIKPLGNVTVIIPQGPDDPNTLLDACIVFFPTFFEKCPSLEKVRDELQYADRMDFNLGKNIPKCWKKLREEAREVFRDLNVYMAKIEPID